MTEPTRLRRWIGQETITEPLPVITRLRNTPYRNPRRGSKSPVHGDEGEELRLSLELVADIGEALLLSGAGTAEVESSILAAGVALGIDEDHFWSDITMGSVVVSFGRPGEWPLTLLRVVRAPARDYAKLSAMHDLVVQLAAGQLERDQVRPRLEAIETAPRQYRRWWVTVAWGVLAAALVLVLGGGPTVMVTGFFTAMIVDRVMRLISKAGWPTFFVTFTGAAIAASISIALAEASAAWGLGMADPQNSSLVIAAGIVLLLAGSSLVAAGQDGINGYPVTAIGRVFEVGLTTSAIAAGVGTVLSLASAWGLAGTIFNDPLAGLQTGFAWWAPPIAAIGSVCTAIGGRSPARLLFVTGLTGALGYAVMLIAEAFGVSAPIAVALGCVLNGSLGRVWALRRRASPMAVVVPASAMMLPGLSIFQSLRYLSTGDTNSGLAMLLSAALTALAIGAGTVVGDLFASPLEHGMATMEEIRDRLADDM